jgi:ABC-2 type transport system permease protein
MRLAWAFFKRDATIAMSYRGAFALQFVGKVLLLGLFYYMARAVGDRPVPALERYGGDFLPFLLVGIALSDCVFVSLVSFANQIREAQTTGTLEVTLMSPVRLPTILLYSSLWDYFMSAAAFATYLAAGAALYGLNLQGVHWPAAAVIFLLTVLSFTGIGILWGALVLLLKRGEVIRTIIGFLIVVFSGVFFPPSLLPQSVQSIAGLIPLTDALEGMRLVLLQGHDFDQLSAIVWRLAVFATALLAIGVAGFNRAVAIGKHTGSLTQY